MEEIRIEPLSEQSYQKDRDFTKTDIQESHAYLFKAVIILYILSAFCLIWFIWVPAFNENPVSFFHSPTFFFMILWFALTILPIIFFLQKTVKARFISGFYVEQTSETEIKAAEIETKLLEDKQSE